MSVFITLAKEAKQFTLAVFESRNEVLALSDAFAAAQAAARAEALAMQDAISAGRGGYSGSGSGRSSRTGASPGNGLPGRGGSSSGSGGFNRGGSSSGSSYTRNTYGFDPGDGAFLGNQTGSALSRARGNSTANPVHSRDDATVNEVRGLRSDIKRNGGLL